MMILFFFDGEVAKKKSEKKRKQIPFYYKPTLCLKKENETTSRVFHAQYFLYIIHDDIQATTEKHQ
jgi:hypothetical protein